MNHGSTCAFICEELCALSLSAMLATRARRDTCDLLMSLLSLNSVPLATCARTATSRHRPYRYGLRAHECPQPRCHTSSLPAQHSARTRAGNGLLHTGVELLLLLAQDSLHRTGVAEITAHTQRRCRHSTSQPCGTRAASFLVLHLCPLSFFGRNFSPFLLFCGTPCHASSRARFLLLFCGTPCHASSRARFLRRILPLQHARARAARTDDAQRRTIRRAVRRSG